MLLEFLFGQMLFIPLIYGVNVTVQNTQNMLNETVPLKDIISNKTKITVVTEGGAITQINSNLTLPHDNKTILMELDKELGTPKNRPIVPRKGVKPEEFVANESTAVNSTNVKDHQIIPNIKVNNTFIKKNHLKLGNNSRIDTSVAADHTDIYVKKAEKATKPPVLIYEVLSGSNHNVQTDAVPSSKTSVSNQMPNPNSDSLGIQREESQPGMIMPVVITILTVPLFVVLGYMALSRGREAWKNRHYKRMDFLLDGMYND